MGKRLSLGLSGYVLPAKRWAETSLETTTEDGRNNTTQLQQLQNVNVCKAKGKGAALTR